MRHADFRERRHGASAELHTCAIGSGPAMVAPMRTSYCIEPCRTALNRVRGMMFDWSINPYMGCAHRCTFCYVRAFEHRADRPSDDRYGRSVRVKTNVVEVLRRELARASWKGEVV